MYTKIEIIKIFRACKTMHDIILCSLILKDLNREGVLPEIDFVQRNALIQTRKITDDGN